MLDRMHPNNSDNGELLDTGVYCVESFNSLTHLDSYSFMIVHQNIRSFRANFDYLAVLLDSLAHVPDVLVLTETWFSSGNCFELNGYGSDHVYTEVKDWEVVSRYMSIVNITFLLIIIFAYAMMLPKLAQLL